MHPTRTISKLLVIVIALFAVFSAMPAGASITIEDEKKLGREFYEKLLKSQVLIEDNKINGYVGKVGRRILESTEKAVFDFHFFVIRSKAINAFATPGGYVYVNQGLVTLVENESELAAVLAHEIAHVNSRHIADIVNKSQKLNLAALAAMLAGAFLGGGGDMTAAVAGFSMAAATSLNLKYSREHEEEADRLGIMYLVNAGYDGRSMLELLKLMRRYEFYSNTIPSYFLTHPGTDERIAYCDALVQTGFARAGAEAVIGRFKRIQTLLLLESDDIDSNLKHFQEGVEKNPNDVDDLYGLAVTEARLGLTPQALEHFQRALHSAPDDVDILKDLGITCFLGGKAAQAVTYLEKASSLTEDSEESLLYLGRSYYAGGDYAAALRTFRQLEKKKPDDPEIRYHLAMAYGKTNNPGESHYNFGLYFKKKHRFDSARFHFQIALKHYPKDGEKYRQIQNELDRMKR
ncbi:MAG: M48 family metalloprotease [Deltaproteobacteria bacterium]|nr:M48 family metalloprotease [Deltaproteobacteria bacterium]